MAAIPGNTAYGMLNAGTTLPTAPTPYSDPNAKTSSVTNPPTPSVPYATPIPGVSTYMGQDAAALKSYNDALASINYNTQQLLTQNGYKANVDPTTGSITNLTVDPNNQYGGLQMMLGGQAREDMSAHDASAGRGFTGGLAHQPEADLRFGHNAADQQFGQQLFGNLQNFNSQRAGANNTYANTLWQDQLQAMMLAIQNQQFNPADFNQYLDPNNFSNSQQAAIGAAGAGDSPFSDTDTLALAHKFGQMTAQQLNDLGVTDSMGNPLRSLPTPVPTPAPKPTSSPKKTTKTTTRSKAV